jgi:hypothetical protein
MLYCIGVAISVKTASLVFWHCSHGRVSREGSADARAVASASALHCAMALASVARQIYGAGLQGLSVFKTFGGDYRIAYIGGGDHRFTN